MVINAVLWGGPEDGRLLQVSDLCYELELTAVGTLITDLPADVIPTYRIRYARTDSCDHSGNIVYCYSG